MQTILIATDNLLDQVNGVVTTFTNIEIEARKDDYIIQYVDPSMFTHFSAIGYNEVKLSIVTDIAEIIKEINPSYIHIATEGPIGLAIRNYCVKHDLNFNTSYHTKFPEFLNKLYRIPECITYGYVRWFHEKSYRVLTTTQTIVNELQAHGFSGSVVPWTRGVDRTNLSPSRGRTTRSKPILLYVGRVSKEKGLDDLCSLSTDKYTIQIVGDGPYRKDLEKRYPAVDFVGYHRGESLANYYQNADVFCFPSRTDTFGIVIIEALSLGTPVAAFHVPGPLDILEPGVNGYMLNNFEESVQKCLLLDRDAVKSTSAQWTWNNCWLIFKSHLINVR